MPLVDGSAIHVALASLYEGKSIADALDAMLQYYAEARGPLENYLPQQVRDIRDNEAWAERLLEAYHDRVFQNDDFTVLGVESEFNVPLGHVCYSCGSAYVWGQEETPTHCPKCGATVYYWVGFADLIVKRNGIIYVMDHKTTKSAGASYLSSWANSFQLIGYCYGVNRCAGFDVGGYCINVIKKLKSIGTDRERGDCFLREYFPLNPRDVERFVHSRLCVIQQIEHNVKLFENPDTRDEAWGMNDTSCGTFGGCFYKPLCWGHVDPLTWYDYNEETVRALLEERPSDNAEMAREEVR